MELDIKTILNDIKDKKRITMSYLQRTYSIGFIKANKEFDKLVEDGYVSESGEVQTAKVYKALGEEYDPGIKLIFLDVDGVLNCSSTKDKCNGYLGIEDEKVTFLKRIVEATNAKIVLVSTWKYYWYKEPNLKTQQDEMADYLDAKLKRQDLIIVDKTEDEELNRGDGVLEYIRRLKWRGIKVDKFIIIDDEIFDYKETKLTRNLIQTGFYGGGLQAKHVIKAIDKLGGMNS